MSPCNTLAVWRTLFLPATVVLLAGCGNSDNAPKPSAVEREPLVQQSPPENAAPPAHPANSPDQQPVAERAPAKDTKKNAAERKSPFLDPSVNPHDVFEIVPEEQKFELAADPRGKISADAFIAVAPPQGVDSAHFELVDPQADQTTTAAKRRPFSVSGPPVQESAIKKSPSRATPERGSSGQPGKGRPSKVKNAESKKPEPKPVETVDSDGAKALPAGFTALPSAKNSRLGWPLRIRCDRDGAEMALVTGGAAAVGHDGGPPESSPQISVVLDSFYMDVTEITLGQYERFREALKEEKGRNIVTEPRNVSSPPDFPVLGVTLLQSQFYARWAGKEIPTEAEWERAARGEGAFDHPWGNGRAIWKQARSQEDIGPVKSFRTDISPFGIYDLAGNAREWCVDRYSPTAFADAMKSSHGSLRNWKGPRRPTELHVVKGNGPNWEAWYRTGVNGVEHPADVGFRCVLRIGGKND